VPQGLVVSGPIDVARRAISRRHSGYLGCTEKQPPGKNFHKAARLKLKTLPSAARRRNASAAAAQRQGITARPDNMICRSNKTHDAGFRPGAACGEKQMRKQGLFLTLITASALALAGCGDRAPNDATGAKVLRNLLDKHGVGAKVVSFKKTQGRELKTPETNAYEYWYEAELQFPEDMDAKCSDEKERGKCAYLGLSSDRSFKKGEVLTSEGTLNFIKTDKGWVGEDKVAY
jgi:hypothetical protein